MNRVLNCLDNMLVVLVVFIAGLFIAEGLLAAPSVTYKGGRYYLVKDGERLPNWYGTDHTAKAAAVNESFKCGCPVTIDQPDIVVTTIFESGRRGVRLTWSAPTKREDGSPLPLESIQHYILESNGIELIVETTTYTEYNLISGTNRFRVATVDVDGERSAFTEYEEVEN